MFVSNGDNRSNFWILQIKIKELVTKAKEKNKATVIEETFSAKVFFSLLFLQEITLTLASTKVEAAPIHTFLSNCEIELPIKSDKFINRLPFRKSI